METTALILAIILFIAGLLGTILPILPGAILIYGGMLLYGFMTEFASLDVNFFLLQALVLALIFSVDFLASAVGTQRFNGSKQAATGAIIGTILGLLFLGPLGLLIGPFLGAVGAELLRGVKIKQAMLVGFGTLVGILGGTVLKLCAGVLMIVYFFMRI
ncbi:DUF456 domain-containing protein [Desulfosporosinus fructosivorans]|uniref:DUF456 domain-containing protein n=1 Tax=Desulfosporosinus fructosivorans TaxID=2018669 RepID=A0A4Z0R0P4_9FIRM|nr:DUF456 domain-containing protein [Desulfosporosinus fructosivorans]TGE35547.1 DUF456 domain-containing protein [Desulfosporosinus fructosivorans]